MARTPNTQNEGSQPEELTYGEVYQKVGDIPADGTTWILPKEDYRRSCYMWIVPNGEIAIPGRPLYGFPTDGEMMTSDLGFLKKDVLSDFGVFAVSGVSDLKEYARRRESGQWPLEMAKLEGQLAVEEQAQAQAQSQKTMATAPTATTTKSAPSAATPAFDWSNVGEMTVNFQLYRIKAHGMYCDQIASEWTRLPLFKFQEVIDAMIPSFTRCYEHMGDTADIMQAVRVIREDGFQWLKDNGAGAYGEQLEALANGTGDPVEFAIPSSTFTGSYGMPLNNGSAFILDATTCTLLCTIESIGMNPPQANA